MRKKHDHAEAERDADAARREEVRAEQASGGARAEAPGSVEDLAARLAEAQEELRAKENDYLRARADLDNVRRRAARESIEVGSRVRGDTVLRFLDILDDLDRALAEPGDASSALREGVGLIREKMLRILRDLSVEPIAALGEPFDPARHEALGGIPSADAAPDTVIQEVRKGYQMEGMVLRPSSVLVALPVSAGDDAEGAR